MDIPVAVGRIYSWHATVGFENAIYQSIFRLSTIFTMTAEITKPRVVRRSSRGRRRASARARRRSVVSANALARRSSAF